MFATQLEYHLVLRRRLGVVGFGGVGGVAPTVGESKGDQLLSGAGQAFASCSAISFM